MSYYTIWVNTNRYRGGLPLTYSSDLELSSGMIVEVPFKNFAVVGVVDQRVAKPSFKTKPVIRVVCTTPLPENDVKLLNWLMSYYPSTSATYLQLLIHKDVLKIDFSDYKNTTLKALKSLDLPKLTVEQEAGLSEIGASRGRTILIHGDTGSGKTRIYTELIYDTLKSGKSAILLTPEIGLTPQLIKTMNDSFGGRVVVMHSGLTNKIRRANWLRIFLSQEPLVVIGPRSALFVPLKDIGLVVIDEAHESSYKQEQSPYYQTTRVAAKIVELYNARLVLGTATPLISDYYILKSKGLTTIRMTKSAASKGETLGEPLISVVKLNDREHFQKSNWLSDELIKSITDSLSANEQSLVFLNRRGTAIVILCQNCGWQALCPNCDTTLTYHADNHTMLCHSCSYHAEVPSQCPVCHSQEVIFKGVGTKAVEEELKKLFPVSEIRRFDKDNKKGESLEENYKDLKSGKIQILVGTQIITKGLDLPKLSTVGVVMADSNLYFPDYTAEERTFQSIMQVIGRVGRGHVAGRVIIQTYSPETPAIKAAIAKRYDLFYEKQILEREQFAFPPFVYLLVLTTKRSSAKLAENAANKLIEELKASGSRIIINGPTPAFHEKVNGKYVWQIIIKSTNRGNLTKLIQALPANWSYDIDPSSLL